MPDVRRQRPNPDSVSKVTYATRMPDERFVRATVCHGCQGHGSTAQPVATASGETAMQVTPCPWCKGTGRLRGFVPPE